MAKGWIGVDLDGTLAKYEGFIAPDVIGEPIPLMVSRVRQWLRDDRDVRIFTARVYTSGDAVRDKDAYKARVAIEDWCLKYIGKILPVTCTKDYSMVALWDDRCIQVEPNTGLLTSAVEYNRGVYNASKAVCKHSNTYIQGSLGEFCSDCNAPIN